MSAILAAACVLIAVNIGLLHWRVTRLERERESAGTLLAARHHPSCPARLYRGADCFCPTLRGDS